MSRLPILMYHKVSSSLSEGLTISAEKLEAQFQLLAAQGYRTYHLSTLSILKKLPQKKRNIVITFDDAYVNQIELAVPLLLKYNLKATFFVPMKFLGGEDEWNTDRAPIMDADTLRSLDPTVVELAYHSYEHRKYTDMKLSEIEADTVKAFEVASENALPMHPYLAYPFGKYPRKTKKRELFFQQLKKQGFNYGLRIGNRVNRFPFKNPFEIQRIDMKGEWGLQRFKRKIRFGKLI